MGLGGAALRDGSAAMGAGKMLGEPRNTKSPAIAARLRKFVRVMVQNVLWAALCANLTGFTPEVGLLDLPRNRRIDVGDCRTGVLLEIPITAKQL